MEQRLERQTQKREESNGERGKGRRGKWNKERHKTGERWRQTDRDEGGGSKIVIRL